MFSLFGGNAAKRGSPSDRYLQVSIQCTRVLSSTTNREGWGTHGSDFGTRAGEGRGAQKTGVGSSRGGVRMTGTQRCAKPLYAQSNGRFSPS
ncbi:hypothetical protein LY78DRAFT_390669 [Colletotrichum sublineola]|nr:hypothetical protein LY78DRAFT_390669 [Colletotrichum sublineola]